MNEVIGFDSHIEEDTSSALPQADIETNDAFSEFGMTRPEPEQEEELDNDPPIDQEPDQEPERKGRTYKFNKEDVFVPEEEVDDYARKGLNYDKIEGRAKTYEAALDRTAKLNGFKDHAEYVANLDRLEQEALQHKTDQLAAMKQNMLDEYEGLGYDPSKLDAFIENNPLFQQAKEIVERDSKSQQEKEEAERQRLEQERENKGWQELIDKYPHVAEGVEEGAPPPAWITPRFDELMKKGYDPIDAYELAHKDTLFQNQRKLTEQAVITQQRLNKRAPLSADPLPTPDTEVPASVRQAFLEFGIDPKEAQKYYKK